MSRRAYRLGQRAIAAQATRERIIATGIDLLSAGGFHRLSLSEVARSAGVGRATVYEHFRSKLGLLQAMLDSAEERAGLPALVHQAETEPDPRRALGQLLAMHCRFWAAGDQVFRNGFALASLDPEAAALMAAKDARRQAGLSGLVQRLAAAGALCPGWSPAQALDALWLLTSFQTYDQLCCRSGLPVGQAGEMLIRLAGSVVDGLPHRQGP